MNKQFNNRISFIEAIGRTDYAKNVKEYSYIEKYLKMNQNRLYL